LKFLVISEQRKILVHPHPNPPPSRKRESLKFLLPGWEKARMRGLK
jgi:hypothetical protein